MRKFTKDDLAYMNDDALQGAYRVVNDIIRNARKNKKRGKTAVEAEEEICYIVREIEWRSERKKAHREYLSQKNR